MVKTQNIAVRKISYFKIRMTLDSGEKKKIFRVEEVWQSDFENNATNWICYKSATWAA